MESIPGPNKCRLTGSVYITAGLIQYTGTTIDIRILPSCREKVKRVNNCGVESVCPEPEALPRHITTTPQSIQSKLSPHAELHKSIFLKRLHVKLLNTLLIHMQYVALM